MQNKRVILFGGLGLFGVCCLAVFALIVVAGLQEEREREQAAADYEAAFGALEEVCNGTPAASAATYQTGTGLHPTAVFRIFDKEVYIANDDFPATWKPAGLANAQLVACIEQTQVLVESCDYDLLDDFDNPTGESAVVERYFYQASVRLIEAQTGKQIELGKFDGSQPNNCTDEVRFNEGQTVSVIYGELVPMSDIEVWLRPYVETP
jgi:hypothetical protein